MTETITELLEEARAYCEGQANSQYAKYHGSIELYTLAVLLEIADRLKIHEADPFS